MGSVNEKEYIQDTLERKSVPTPKLLIKDHKEKNAFGEFPTRLVVPATNFTADFPKVGYLGVKAILDWNGINYSRSTIIQASQLKASLEKLNLKESEVTIASFDAVEMYPSIKFKLVKKAIGYFTRDLCTQDKRTIESCLDIIRFGMGNTLLTFVDKYYEYGGDEDMEDRGLTIGGYESAWLADLVVSYILECADDCFENTRYKGIYRDDGIVIFDGDWMKRDISVWLHRFQSEVNKLAGSDYLRFTMEIWGKDKDDGTRDGSVSVCKKDALPYYLDMELYWSEQGDLFFCVHIKPNQQIKYLNRGSAHTESCFRAIPSGVMKCLALLTTRMEESMEKGMDELYPRHAEALHVVKLAPESFPTLGKVLEDLVGQSGSDDDENKLFKKKRKNKDNRMVYFCVTTSKIWEEPIRVTLDKLKKQYGLSCFASRCRIICFQI